MIAKHSLLSSLPNFTLLTSLATFQNFLIQSLSNSIDQNLYFLVTWALIIFFVWKIWSAAKGGIATIKRLHQIPCTNYQFFTGNYYLKCPVHPNNALTEEAINCSDYAPINGRSSY